MATHMCQLSKPLSWDQIKRSIFGLQRFSDKYICGKCSKTFETICYLHFHCLHFHGGGSYYFDHLTNTAFPKTDQQIKNVLTGYARETSNYSSEQRSKQSETKNEIKSDGTRREKEEGKGVALVKMRNMLKGGGSSDTFEMDKNYAHLFDEKPNTIIYQLKTSGKMSELKVLVPVKSVSERSCGAFASVCSVATSDFLNTNIKAEDDTVTRTCETSVNVNSAKWKDEDETDSDQHDQVSEDTVVPTADIDEDSHIRKHTKRTGKNDINVGDDNMNQKAPVLIRSTRKRKITRKMQESELTKKSKISKKKFVTEKEVEKGTTGRENTKQIRKRNSNGEQDSPKVVQADVSFNDALPSLTDTQRSSMSSSTNPSASLSVELKQDEQTMSTNMSKLHQIVNTEDSTGIDGTNEVKCQLCDKPVHDDVKFTDGKHTWCDHTFKIKPVSETKLIATLNVNAEKRIKGRRNKLTKNNKDPSLESKHCTAECRTCGKVGNKAMIKYHEEIHSNQLLYTCDECGKCFNTAIAKKNHVMLHGEKKWQCDQCPAAFYRKMYLDTHLTIHSGEPRYMCEVCGVKFRDLNTVRRHVHTVHNNIRNFKCDICEREFFRAASRDTHRLRHFEPTLQCSSCPKKFKCDLDLRNHELIHTGVKVFLCPLCGIGFYRIYPYYRHMRNIHNIQKDEAREIKIKNPDIVNMRNIKTDTSKNVHVKKCDVTKTFSPNTSEFITENDGQSMVYNKDIGDNNSVSEESVDMECAGTISDHTGTIVETVVTVIETADVVEHTPGHVVHVVDDNDNGVKCLQ